MQIPKEQILSMIESRVGGDQAQQAAQQLPDQVDHEQHSDLLSQFGIDPQELARRFGGGGGGGGQASEVTGGGGGGQSDQVTGGGQGGEFTRGAGPRGGGYTGSGTQDAQSY